MNDTSQENLRKRILSIIVNIQNEFPELTKYLNEQPVYLESNTDNNVNTDSLKEYLDSLHTLLETYKKEHIKHI